MINKIFNISYIVFIVLILLLTVRGIPGNVTKDNINTGMWREKGPFELSPERGRFALTFTLVEDRSYQFSIPVARFILPDLGYKNGKYVSLFAPGVSLIAVPGYVIGKFFGLNQLGTYLTASFFALFNVILIRKIAFKLGASWVSASVAGMVFLFTTPAFSYASTLYQHHISVLLILLSIYILMTHKGALGIAIISVLYCIGILVDYPNALMMLPILIYSLINIIKIRNIDRSLQINILSAKIIGAAACMPVLILLLLYNKQAYGNYLQFAGTVASVTEIKMDGSPVFPGQKKNGIELTQEKYALNFFKTRNTIKGLYTHLISPDRGVIFYAPSALFGIWGIVELRRRKPKISALIVALILTNLILYSMWGDPWGGWAFGSRYLIPSYALLSILVAMILPKFKNEFLFVIAVLIIGYSASINSLGVLTSYSNPPKIEAASLSIQTGKEEKYTIERNIDLIRNNESKSFIYNSFLSDKFSVLNYYLIVNFSIVFIMFLAIVYINLIDKEKIDNFTKSRQSHNYQTVSGNYNSLDNLFQ